MSSSPSSSAARQHATLSSSEHRKIDLQSAGDLAHVRAQIRRAAREKLDRALPPAAAAAAVATGDTGGAGGSGKAAGQQEEEDPLRRRVAELVDAYVARVWDGVRGNVRVNGVDVVAAVVAGSPDDQDLAAAGDADGAAVAEEHELEAFDARLADRIRALEAQRETLTERVADLRRSAPAAAASGFETTYLSDTAALDREAGAQAEAVLSAAADVRLDLAAGKVPALDRWDDVRATWEAGSAGLVGLKAGLGETRAKVERAKEAAAYVEG